MDGSLGPFLPATSFDLICTSAAFISVLSDGTESTGALFCYVGLDILGAGWYLRAQILDGQISSQSVAVLGL
jgi:hypothetical protein